MARFRRHGPALLVAWLVLLSIYGTLYRLVWRSDRGFAIGADTMGALYALLGVIAFALLLPVLVLAWLTVRWLHRRAA